MTSIPKSAYIDKIDDTVNEYNNTNYRTIKIKPINIKGNTYIILVKKLIIMILNLTLVIM